MSRIEKLQQGILAQAQSVMEVAEATVPRARNLALAVGLIMAATGASAQVINKHECQNIGSQIGSSVAAVAVGGNSYQVTNIAAMLGSVAGRLAGNAACDNGQPDPNQQYQRKMLSHAETSKLDEFSIRGFERMAAYTNAVYAYENRGISRQQLDEAAKGFHEYRSAFIRSVDNLRRNGYEVTKYETVGACQASMPVGGNVSYRYVADVETRIRQQTPACGNAMDIAKSNEILAMR